MLRELESWGYIVENKSMLVENEQVNERCGQKIQDTQKNRENLMAS